MSKKTVKRIIHGSIAFILAIIFLSPFYVLVTNSFKTPKGIFKDIFGLPGEYFTLQNYKNAFIELDFVKTFFNSSLITIVGTALIITTSCMAAWVYASIGKIHGAIEYDERMGTYYYVYRFWIKYGSHVFPWIH